jgi:hypothetical protein
MDCNSKIYQMMGLCAPAMVLAVVMSREYYLSLPHLLFVPDDVVAAAAGLDTPPAAAVEAVRRTDVA